MNRSVQHVKSWMRPLNPRNTPCQKHPGSQVRSTYLTKRIFSRPTLPLSVRLSIYSPRSFLWSRLRESVLSGRLPARRSMHSHTSIAFTFVYTPTHANAHPHIRTTWYVSAKARVCGRISWNTRSSNPLLETRLIPHIEICLWRALLPCYWLGVISCKLGCLAAGVPHATHTRARALGPVHIRPRKFHREPGLFPDSVFWSLLLPLSHTRSIGQMPDVQSAHAPPGNRIEQQRFLPFYVRGHLPPFLGWFES